MPPKEVEKTCYNTKRDIVALSNYGAPVSEIAEETGASERNIYQVVAQYKQHGHIHDLPRSGRPPALTEADKMKIKGVVLEHPAYPLRDIMEASGLNVSHNTVDKALKEARFTLYIKRKKPFLKPHHKHNRVDWCKRCRSQL